MGSRRVLIASAVVTVLIGLVALFPARVAYHSFLQPSLAVRGIQGSVWHGSASEASINGIYLRNIEWRAHPLAFFTGKLSFSMTATSVSGPLASEVKIAPDGVISLAQLTAAVPMDPFAGALGIPGLKGIATLTFERMEITNGLTTAADGTLQIVDLIVPFLGQNSLGDYTAEFFTQNNGISASVEDSEGVIDLAGSLQLKTDRSYEFIAQVIVKSDTPQTVRQRLALLPPPNARGQYEIRLEGVL